MGIDNILISNSIYSSKENFTGCADEYKIKPFNYSVATKWMFFFFIADSELLKNIMMFVIKNSNIILIFGMK